MYSPLQSAMHKNDGSTLAATLFTQALEEGVKGEVERCLPEALGGSPEIRCLVQRVESLHSKADYIIELLKRIECSKCDTNHSYSKMNPHEGVDKKFETEHVYQDTANPSSHVSLSQPIKAEPMACSFYSSASSPIETSQPSENFPDRAAIQVTCEAENVQMERQFTGSRIHSENIPLNTICVSNYLETCHESDKNEMISKTTVETTTPVYASVVECSRQLREPTDDGKPFLFKETIRTKSDRKRLHASDCPCCVQVLF